YHRNNNGSYQWENTRTSHTYRSHPPERWNHPTAINEIEPDVPPSVPVPTPPVPVPLPVATTETDDPPF
ncbi:MAG: hypothetical protein JWM76_1496, partial [Pseudonocardiales bacterium]|nr:hypothetical protein [Pseudonocardiales bacterium]